MIEKYPSYNFDNFFYIEIVLWTVSVNFCPFIWISPFYRVVPLLLFLMNEPVGLSECPVKEGNFCFKIVSLKPLSDQYCGRFVVSTKHVRVPLRMKIVIFWI